MGSGSEGDIYVVSDRKRKYALKLCHSRFYTNVKVMPAMQKLNGKGYISDIVDYGDDFELLEYIPGGNAASAGLKGNAEAILIIAAKTAMSLSMIHQAGVLHKDVKPANILIKDSQISNPYLCGPGSLYDDRHAPGWQLYGVDLQGGFLLAGHDHPVLVDG